MSFNLKSYGIEVPKVFRNISPAEYYEEAVRYEATALITSTGALAVESGKKTGRSPSDKRLVDNPESSKNIWWGGVNIRLDEHVFHINHARALDYFNTRESIYVVDGFGGWDEKHRIKVRIICTRPYHALFMYNMLIRPTAEELKNFGEPDYVILNAGCFPANRLTAQMTSDTSIDLSFEKRMMIILGTEYAGEMKKGVFTIMNYIMPKANVLSMHCSANEGNAGDVSLFFGLSGTGKTTLSADEKRKLIGDDEHCWTEEGVFNIEGGCYAKCINLKKESEPEIFDAIKFGSLLENVVVDPTTRIANYDDSSLTQNTRASYPIEYIPNAKIPCRGGHPRNIIFLTCDAFGVLPPVSKLTAEQAMYHFISGYTAKIAGTEQGVVEPEATFSACFGAAFLVWHPSKYAELLAEKIRTFKSQAWLINTGWTGGAYGKGSRIKLKFTRAIIDAIHSGTLEKTATVIDPVFRFEVPSECVDVPSEILIPKNSWESASQFDEASKKLAKLFQNNFEKYKSGCTNEICNAGPVV